jgi:hypothetical protein
MQGNLAASRLRAIVEVTSPAAGTACSNIIVAEIERVGDLAEHPGWAAAGSIARYHALRHGLDGGHHHQVTRCRPHR